MLTAEYKAEKLELLREAKGMLSLTAKGDPILSWIETSKDGGDSLRYSVRQAGKWSAAPAGVQGPRGPSEM